jgi:hypothetical protein
MTTTVEEMWDLLPKLAIREKELRSESTSLCYPVRDASGKVELQISDEDRYQNIQKELADIAAERAKIEDKLLQLKELLGSNDANCVPVAGGENEYAARLKADLGNRFFNKILKAHNPWLTPEEAIASTEYLAVKNEIMPKIEAIERRDKEAIRLSIAAYAILRA